MALNLAIVAYIWSIALGKLKQWPIWLCTFQSIIENEIRIDIEIQRHSQTTSDKEPQIQRDVKMWRSNMHSNKALHCISKAFSLCIDIEWIHLIHHQTLCAYLFSVFRAISSFILNIGLKLWFVWIVVQSKHRTDKECAQFNNMSSWYIIHAKLTYFWYLSDEELAPKTIDVLGKSINVWLWHKRNFTVHSQSESEWAFYSNNKQAPI